MKANFVKLVNVKTEELAWILNVQCPPDHEGSHCQYKKCRNGGIRIETGECKCPEVFEGGFSFHNLKVERFFN
jgi:hypothetical protein